MQKNPILFPGKIRAGIAQQALATGFLAMLVTAAPLWAQPFVPQYSLAPGWVNEPGFDIQTAASGVVAGRQQVAASAASAAAFGVLGSDSSPSSITYLPAAPANTSGDVWYAASTLQNRYLFGGQTNYSAFTLSQTGNFGSGVTVRFLQPDGYLSSVVNGVSLATNQNGFVETAVGTVSGFIIPEAAWWEDGSFQLLPGASGGYSIANAVSGYESTEYYNNDRGDYEPTNVPAFYVVGTAGTNFTSPEHAYLWTRGTYAGAGYMPIDIHPAGFASSEALGVGDVYANAYGGTGTWFVGDAVPTGGGDAHALIWENDYNQVHDVHPAGFQSSSARATAFSHTVGVATTTNGLTHAILWAGFTPVDLHGYFPGATDSEATGITPDGRIAGSYHDASQQLIPFVLVPLAPPPLTATNIAKDTLVDTNGLQFFKLYSPQYYSAAINDSGVTSFIAQNSQLPDISVIFTRVPGGPPVPRLSQYEPLAGGLISGIENYSLDGTGQIHAIVDVNEDNETKEVLVQTNGVTSVLTKIGDLLPDGAPIGAIDYLTTSEDGQVVLTGADTNGGAFLLLRKGNTTTLVTHQPAGYTSGTNLASFLDGFAVGGISTNGTVVFTADRYIYTDPYDKYNAGRSLFRWSSGKLTELLPLGSALPPGLRLARAEDNAINTRGDIVLYGFATNSLGTSAEGYWRRPAGQTNWEGIVLTYDYAPSGVIDALNGGRFVLNNAGALLFNALVDGQPVDLISRPGQPLANFRAGQDTNGLLDLNTGSFNVHEESVSIPTSSPTDERDLVEFYAPRPGLANVQPAGAGVVFDLQAPALNRPYAILATTNYSGPWSLMTTIWATNSLTTVSDTNDCGDSKCFFRAQRVP